MTYRNKLRRSIPWIVACIFLVFFSAFSLIKEDLFKISKNLDIFAMLYRQVSLHYVDELDPDKLIRSGIDAMLDELDPYTEYVGEKDVENYKLKYVNTHYGGIGAAIFSRDSRIFISEPFAGYPAQKAGLKAGDEIVRIDDVAVAGKTTSEVSSLLKGTRNSPVKLVVRHPFDQQQKELSLLREDIQQPNVSYSGRISDGIGYIKLDKFLEKSSDEVQQAILTLQKERPLTGIILDLRNNGGGILQEAVRIVNLFVPQGEVVVSQQGKNGLKQHVYRTANQPVAGDIPLAVLIDNRSASASEIVAGAIQDLDRGVIVGHRSFGKGLVQQTFSLPYNNLVKVTVAKYYTPSGRCIQVLDYAHRDNQGKASRMNDSLISEYKTKGGRLVYDGSGIYPDIPVDVHPFSPVTRSLVNRFLIFDYATRFHAAHAHIASATGFRMTDAQYTDFMHFLADKNFEYKTRTEQLIGQLTREAETEKKPDTVLTAITRLAELVSANKERDLEIHKEEIKTVLGDEIAARYYYQKGRTEYNQQHDPVLKEASQLLTTGKEKYLAILSGKDDFHAIGRPNFILAHSAAD